MSSETLAPVAPARPERPVRRRRRAGRLRPKVLGLAGVLTFVAIWALVCAIGLVDERFLPSPGVVLPEFIRALGQSTTWIAVGDTMLAWAIGLVIAIVLGTALGLVIGLVPFLRKATASTIELLRPMPSVALIPLAVLLFGVKIESTLMLVVYACFWQILIQVLYGAHDVDPVAVQTARSFQFGPLARLRYVVVPTVLPYLLTGIRLAASVALILAITAEMFIGAPGLGRAITLAQTGNNVPLLYAYIVIAGLLGVVINTVMRLIERRSLDWHESVRSEVIA